MTRMVNCVVLKREAEGLDSVPHPGELGQRIYSDEFTTWRRRKFREKLRLARHQ